MLLVEAEKGLDIGHRWVELYDIGIYNHSVYNTSMGNLKRFYGPVNLQKLPKHVKLLKMRKNYELGSL